MVASYMTSFKFPDDWFSMFIEAFASKTKFRYNSVDNVNKALAPRKSRETMERWYADLRRKVAEWRVLVYK